MRRVWGGEYHTHDEEQKLKPGEVVKVEVEVWPTGTLFKKGDRIQLDVRPTDPGYRVFTAESLKQETDSIYTGGNRDSHLLLPVIPGTRGQGTSVSPGKMP